MKVLFVQKDGQWLKTFKKSFNGNYKNHQFDFRKSPRSAVGRFIRGQKYDIVMIDYGWSIKGLKKQIEEMSPQSSIFVYSQMRCKPEDCDGIDITEKNLYKISDKLRLHGVRQGK